MRSPVGYQPPFPMMVVGRPTVAQARLCPDGAHCCWCARLEMPCAIWLATDGGRARWWWWRLASLCRDSWHRVARVALLADAALAPAQPQRLQIEDARVGLSKRTGWSMSAAVRQSNQHSHYGSPWSGCSASSRDCMLEDGASTAFEFNEGLAGGSAESPSPGSAERARSKASTRSATTMVCIRNRRSLTLEMTIATVLNATDDLAGLGRRLFQ